MVRTRIRVRVRVRPETSQKGLPQSCQWEFGSGCHLKFSSCRSPACAFTVGKIRVRVRVRVKVRVRVRDRVRDKTLVSNDRVRISFTNFASKDFDYKAMTQLRPTFTMRCQH